MKQAKSIQKYILVVLGITWLFWIPAAILSQHSTKTIPTLLHYLGGAAPFFVTLFFLFRLHSQAERKLFWQRLTQLNRISLPWVGFLFLIVPLLTLSAAGIDRLLGGNGIEAVPIGGVVNWVSLAVFLFVFGPLPEEIAWRGYLQEQLQQKQSPMYSAVLVGVIWMVWHLPLFWIVGSYQYELGIGTLPFWLFLLDKIPMSVVLAWVMVNTSNSTLSAILLHFMINFTGEIFDLSVRAEAINILLWWALVPCIFLMVKQNQTHKKVPV